MWRPRRKPVQTIPSLVEIVDTIFANHPRDCVFAPGARERIIAHVESHSRMGIRIEVIDLLEAAFKPEEIYCPHEGIDRRAEFDTEFGMMGHA